MSNGSIQIRRPPDRPEACEGLILDPVYTGKTMAGFLQRAREAEAGRSLLFIHTGGTPALFAYGDHLTDRKRRKGGEE